MQSADGHHGDRMAEDMIRAAEKGDLDGIRRLAAAGAPFNENRWGESPMIMAAKRADVDCIRLLAELGASASEPSRLGWTPLMAACGATAGSAPEALRALAALGAELDARESAASGPGSGGAPGEYGSDDGQGEDQLGEPPHMGLLTGWELGGRRDGDSALMFACLADDSERADQIAATLLELGASPSLANRHGVTPLMVAASMDRRELVGILIRAGAPMEDRDAVGCTALMRALQAFAVEPALELLRAGADPRASAISGVSCADWARAMEHQEVCEALEGALALAAARELSAALRPGADSAAGRPRV